MVNSQEFENKIYGWRSLTKHRSVRMKKRTLIFILTLCMLVGRCWGESDGLFGFREVARIPAGTAAHSAVVLGNGDVLVVGGLGKLFGLPLAVTRSEW